MTGAVTLSHVGTAGRVLLNRIALESTVAPVCRVSIMRRLCAIDRFDTHYDAENDLLYFIAIVALV